LPVLHQTAQPIAKDWSLNPPVLLSDNNVPQGARRGQRIAYSDAP